jgi:RNA polymerase sigma factor (TIGR02999 family)
MAEWMRVKRIFFGAVSLPPGERSAFLVRACEGDSNLLRDVEELLASGEAMNAWSEQPFGPSVTDLAFPGRASAATPELNAPATRLGPFLITLQTTDLVHEAYLRLQKQGYVRWQNRGHVIGVAARMMRRILVDRARRRRADKRGGMQLRVPLDAATEVQGPPEVDVTKLDEALTMLAGFDPRQARVAELRIFGDTSVEIVAEHLSVSPATVKREWRMARAWLMRELVRSGAL